MNNFRGGWRIQETPKRYRLIVVIGILAVLFLRVLFQYNGCIGTFRGPGSREPQTECGDLVNIYRNSLPKVPSLG